MTTDIIELSKQAAEVLGVPAFVEEKAYLGSNTWVYKPKWLAEDSGRCAEIAVDKMINVYHDDYSVATNYRGRFMLADHNGDRKQAWRVAVLKAVIELGRQS